MLQVIAALALGVVLGALGLWTVLCLWACATGAEEHPPREPELLP